MRSDAIAAPPALMLFCDHAPDLKAIGAVLFLNGGAPTESVRYLRWAKRYVRLCDHIVRSAVAHDIENHFEDLPPITAALTSIMWRTAANTRMI